MPVLITDEGERLYDSPVICEYLDSLHQGAKLIPPAGKARWTALRRQALADGILDATILRRQELLRPEALRSPNAAEKQKGKVEAGLDALEVEAASLGDPGGPADIGRIAIGCALGYLDFRFPAEDWRKGRLGLAAWYEGFAQRPAMRATLPKEPA